MVKEVTIKDEFLIERHGKPFVLYAGLIDAFHRKYEDYARSITTHLHKVEFDERGEPLYAVALATVSASVDDGAHTHTYSGIGDATRKNVGGGILPHLIRMAETRAKARALRDAVNVAVAALEELGGEEEALHAQQDMPSRREILLQELQAIARDQGYKPKSIGRALERWSKLNDDELQLKVYEMLAENSDG